MAAVLATPAAAYYHFTHYTSNIPPFQPIQEKFDLSGLPNKTLTFYVSDNIPAAGQLLPTDSVGSVLGAFEQAIATWNAVGSSELRLAFGGLYAAAAPSNAPSAQIIFSDDVPPGIVEQAGPVTRLGATVNANGRFVPIVTSQILVRRNLAQQGLRSSTEEFFETAVHEVGHALGLQHTWTSSAMSTVDTRATNHARPIDTDDVAGITLLYPKPGALAQYGSITGRILSGGQPVHLASVVAIQPNSAAVSSLTQPDGTYRIDGLPPGTYWVYVHPLPPAVQNGLGPGDIVLPVDANQNKVPASGAIQTLFYPGTRDPNSFAPIQVSAGAVVPLNDMNVPAVGAPAIHNVSSYTFFGSVPEQPGFVNSNAPVSTIVPTGTGLLNGTAMAPGLGVQVLGGSLSVYNLRTYVSSGNTYLAVDMTPSLVPGTGPRHLYFTLPNDAYVLPNAMYVVQKQPPSVAAAVPQADGNVVVSGSNIQPDSRVFFDSLPAVSRGFTGNDAAGNLIVVPPVGASGQVAQVVVYNSDGQNSTFLQPNPPSFGFGFSPAPAFTLNAPTNTLPAGSTAMIDITGANTNFVSGLTTVGIGSSDITVQHVWVLTPTHLWVNVSVSPSATPGVYSGTVITGFQWAQQPFSFLVTPAVAAAGLRPNIQAPPVTVSGQTTISPGAIVSILGSNLSLNPSGAGITLSLGGQPINPISASPTQVNFAVPAAMPLGPALLALNNGSADAFPVVVEIDNPPPVVVSVLSSTGQPVDATHPDSAGDIIAIVLQNLDPATTSNPGRVHLTEGSIDLAALAVTPVPGQAGLLQAQFALSPAITSQQVQLVVMQDGVASNAVSIAVR